MSEIDASITSDLSPPLHCSTFKSPSKNNTLDFKNETFTSGGNSIDKINNNNSLTTKNRCTDPPEAKNHHKNILPKLKIINNKQMNYVSKEQCISDDNIAKYMQTTEKTNEQISHSVATLKQKKPIMGQTALLQKAKIERNDSQLIQELITNRYNPMVNDFSSRIYQRRLSRLASLQGECETVFSSPTDFSPSVSMGSIDICSNGIPHEKNVFSFMRNNEQGLEFFKSTDSTNIDTSVSDMTSLDSSAISNKSYTNFPEYDPKKFLGSTIEEVSVLSSESGMDNGDHEGRESKQKENRISTGTLDTSSFISRASSLYNSMKKGLKRNSMRRQKTSPNENQIQDNRCSAVSDNSLLSKLKNEFFVQSEIMLQVAKALNYCKTIKGFQTTVEFIEAEKMLLVASCTKSALTKEIEKIDNCAFEKKITDSRSRGDIYLNNLKFFPKDGFKVNSQKDLQDHFVVILTCGSTVLASDVTQADLNGIIHVEKCFEFKNLATDLEISICVYAMRIPGKSHHNQEHSNCPSPKKFFLNKVSRKYKVTNQNSYITPSLFLLWGQYELRSSDLLKISPNKEGGASVTLKMYDNTPSNSFLSGIFSVNINTNVKFDNRMNGFLTIGLDNEHGCTIWNRRWCVLEGTTLKYWNYPSEEVTSPLGGLDLSYCLDRQISTVDRSLCARPRTIMVPVRYKETERKYLLSADNISDMKEWENEINYVICALSIWNCRSGKIQSQRGKLG